VKTCRAARGTDCYDFRKVAEVAERCNWSGVDATGRESCEQVENLAFLAGIQVLGASSYSPESTSTYVPTAYEFSPIVPE